MYMRKCRYVENHENGEHTYTFTGPCVVTGNDYSVTVKGPDLFRYNQGESIQDAFPYLSRDDREFLISGTSPKGWEDMFGFEDGFEPIAEVTVAIGHSNNTWEETSFQTELTYEQCKDESLLMAEASDILDLGSDVSFITMTHYETLEPEKVTSEQVELEGE